MKEHVICLSPAAAGGVCGVVSLMATKEVLAITAIVVGLVFSTILFVWQRRKYSLEVQRTSAENCRLCKGNPTAAFCQVPEEFRPANCPMKKGQY